MLHLLKRHPIPVAARFDFTLALTFALPAATLERLLYPGLMLDQYEGSGFVAVAMVQTRAMRPEFLPACLGGNFFLTGYRIFVRYRTREGRLLRGLQVLRSDTDKSAMVALGNLFTHYHYSLAEVAVRRSASRLAVEITTPRGEADFDATVQLDSEQQSLPAASVFPDVRTARRFAGPMPFTFSYEPETRSIVRIEGQRKEWRPRLVPVEVRKAAFFKSRGLSDGTPRPASAFLVEHVPYRWDRGIIEPLRFGMTAS
jgi:Uncharacterized conserved protein (COG2071)